MMTINDLFIITSAEPIKLEAYAKENISEHLHKPTEGYKKQSLVHMG